LPGKGNAGETAEVFRLVPGELAEIFLAVLPEEPKRFRTFGEGKQVAALILRGQDFEPVEVLVFGRLRDAAGDRDTLDVHRPSFARGTRNGFRLFQLGDVVAESLG